VGRSAGFDRESWDGRSVRELGVDLVCERAGREMVLGGNGFGLLVSRERERGENFFGEMVFVPPTRDFGFKFFLIKCHCHVGKWLMKDEQKAPL
jgi:hypothetical protein